MPVRCKKIGSKFRIVGPGGNIETSAKGNALDGGGHDSEAACSKQARAINVHVMNANGDSVRTQVVASNPFKADPTRTATLRKRFMAEFNKRFLKLKSEIIKLVVDEDAFGLRATMRRTLPSFARNQRFAFRSTTEQVQGFREWLGQQVDQGILTISDATQADDAYWRAYVEAGYRKGAGRAFDDTGRIRRAVAGTTGGEQLAFFKGTRDEFLRTAFSRPVAIEQVKVLAGRVFTELKGVTESMAQRMTRELTDGLVQGLGPRQVAGRLNKAIDIGRKRALTIARTELIRSHAQGQLDSLEMMGVDKVGVMAEWKSVGADACFPADTMILTDNGERPIQDIKVGDSVVTRQGPKKVLKVFARNYEGQFRKISAGQHTVIATSEHPFWTKEADWQPASKLTLDQTLQTAQNQLVKVRRLVDFSFTDTKYRPAIFFEKSGFSNVSFLVSVPIVAIHFKDGLRFHNQEIYRVSSDLGFLHKLNSQALQTQPNGSFDRSLVICSAVTGCRAIFALANVARFKAKSFPAGAAPFINRRAVAFFRTVFPVVFVCIEKRFLASPAVSEFTNTKIIASLRTANEFRGSSFGYFGRATTNSTIFKNQVAPAYVIALPGAKRPFIAFTEPSSVMFGPANGASGFVASPAGFSVASVRAKPLVAAFFFCGFAPSPEMLAALGTIECESASIGLFPKRNIATVRAKPTGGASFDRSRSSFECYLALRANELEGHKRNHLDLQPTKRTSTIVYNLQVEDQPEYYANGLLVHNCPMCFPLEGTVLKIGEARGMIPRHPSCRCAWVPANVGEPTKGQTRSKTAIEKSISQSLKAGQGRTASTWQGADATIAGRRPKSILDKTKPAPKPKPKPKPTPKPQPKPDVPIRRFKDRTEFIRWARQRREALKLTDAQLKDLGDYRFTAYRDVNRLLREQEIIGREARQNAERIIRNLDKVLKKSQLDEPMELWRGMASRSVAQQIDDGTLRVGSVVSDDAFVSTSVDRKIAKRFTDQVDSETPVMFRIRTRPGQRGYVFPEGTESEILLPRGTKFRVVDVGKMDDGIRLVTMEVDDVVRSGPKLKPTKPKARPAKQPTGPSGQRLPRPSQGILDAGKPIQERIANYEYGNAVAKRIADLGQRVEKVQLKMRGPDGVRIKLGTAKSKLKHHMQLLDEAQAAGDSASVRAQTRIIKKTEKEIAALDKELRKLQTEFDKLNPQTELERLLAIDDRLGVQVDLEALPGADKATEDIRWTVQSATGWLEKRLGRMGSKQAALRTAVKHSPVERRAFYSVLDNEIVLPSSASRSTVLHELGHALENHLSSIQARAQEFLRYRVSGETPQRLRDVMKSGSYRFDETGSLDRFDRAFGDNGWYVGKVYSQGDTEIISMGLEQMFVDPVHFARNDPEFFSFLVGILRGNLR